MQIAEVVGGLVHPKYDFSPHSVDVHLFVAARLVVSGSCQRRTGKQRRRLTEAQVAVCGLRLAEEP